MQKLQKILMILSLLFIIICFGACVWAAMVTHDYSFYMMAVVFVLAIIWFSVTIYKSKNK